MVVSTRRVRVPEKREAYHSDDPRIVMFALDPDSLVFMQVSGSAEELLGYPKSRWLEQGFWPERIHPDDRETALKYRANQIGAGVDHEHEYRVINRDGETRWVHEIVEFGTDPGTARGYIMDITQRVAQEANVQGAWMLKSQLLRIVTEELSHPMNEISGYGNLLERHLSARHDDVGSDIAVGLRSGIERLHAVLAQLRDIALNGELDYEELSSALAELTADRRTLSTGSAGN